MSPSLRADADTAPAPPPRSEQPARAPAARSPADLCQPIYSALDTYRNGIFIAERCPLRNVVRRVDIGTFEVGTVVGVGNSAGLRADGVLAPLTALNQPWGVAPAAQLAAGDLIFIAEEAAHVVRVVTNNATMVTVAGEATGRAWRGVACLRYHLVVPSRWRRSLL